MRNIAALIFGATLLGGIGQAQAAPAPGADLGEVSFPNSCAAAAQAPFLRGLALLHDFEYEDSAAAFLAAQHADPGCAIAYWGQAMTFNHTVWMEQDAAGGRKALAGLAATPALRAAKAKTPREAAYVHAVETLYGTGNKNARDVTYAAEMAALHARFPDDVDATAFTALALLGTAHHGRDIPTYMKAAAMLEEVFPSHQHHPGVLHYLIHSYDDPAHAPLGMRAARLYGSIASGAPHAVHMTSHIFLALGLWDGVIAANDAAIKAVNAKDPGGPPYACGHYPEWLVYGYLQERRFTEANAAIGRCRTMALSKLAKQPQKAFPGRSSVISYAGMQARAFIEEGAYRPESNIPLNDGAFIEARFYNAYTAVLASASDPQRLHAASAELHKNFALLQNQPPGDDADGLQQEIQFWTVMVEEAGALELAAGGNPNAAIASLRLAAEHEISIPTEFGPPAVPKPPFELLGDILLKTGKPQDAAGAYQAALVRAPGRTLSLQGLGAAQAKLGAVDGLANTERLLHQYVRQD